MAKWEVLHTIDEPNGSSLTPASSTDLPMLIGPLVICPAVAVSQWEIHDASKGEMPILWEVISWKEALSSLEYYCGPDAVKIEKQSKQKRKKLKSMFKSDREHASNYETDMRKAVDHAHISLSTVAQRAGSIVNSDQNNDEQVWSICHDHAKDPMVTACAHVFCKACLIDFSASLDLINYSLHAPADMKLMPTYSPSSPVCQPRRHLYASASSA